MMIQLLKEGNTAAKKTGIDLLAVDIKNRSTVLSKKKVFIGQEASKLIRQWGLNPDSPQLKCFFEAVFKFYQKLVEKLFGYFETALKSTELAYMSSLAPENRTNITTSYQLKYLATTFSKVADNISQFGGQDTLRKDIDNYTVDDDLVNVDAENITYEEYWDKVGDLKEDDWSRYEVLPRFAKALGTIFNSNSETERAFSVQSDIHRDPKRNQMSQDMFDSHMQIHFCVESKASKSSCVKCKDDVGKKCPQPHCHCSVAKITTEMKDNCKDAYKAMKKDLEALEVKEMEKTVSEKQKAAEIAFEEKRKKFCDDLKTREIFYNPSLMANVYTDKPKVKNNLKGVPSESWKTMQQLNTSAKVKVAEKVVVSQKVKNTDGGKSSKQGSGSGPENRKRKPESNTVVSKKICKK